MTNFIRSMLTPQETTMADVMFFYVCIVSRYMPEWTAILVTLPA